MHFRASQRRIEHAYQNQRLVLSTSKLMTIMLVECVDQTGPDSEDVAFGALDFAGPRDAEADLEMATILLMRFFARFHNGVTRQ